MAKQPEKTSFSVTCSLLSQYMKENCRIADQVIGFPTRALDCACLGKVGTNWPPATMNLISCVDAKDASKSMSFSPQSTDFVEAKPPENSQLTIFYGGKMLVFDNILAEKARDLIQLASKGQSFTSETTSPVFAGELPALNCQATVKPPARFPARTKPNLSDLPIARKASLHRFLEKRRDRISAKSPYQLNHSNGSKESVNGEETSQPWLGLGTHKLYS